VWSKIKVGWHKQQVKQPVVFVSCFLSIFYFLSKTYPDLLDEQAPSLSDIVGFEIHWKPEKNLCGHRAKETEGKVRQNAKDKFVLCLGRNPRLVSSINLVSRRRIRRTRTRVRKKTPAIITLKAPLIKVVFVSIHFLLWSLYFLPYRIKHHSDYYTEY